MTKFMMKAMPKERAQRIMGPQLNIKNADSCSFPKNTGLDRGIDDRGNLKVKAIRPESFGSAKE